MAHTTDAAPRTSARVHVQRFGTFLSNMVLPNIGAFIAWGLITAVFIETGWLTGIFDGIGPGSWVAEIGGWGDYAGGGIVGPMITYLLPLLIGYTGGRMTYDDTIRGGVVGAIATMGVIAGSSVPMFLGAMIMGPLGGWSMKRLDALWSHKIRPGFEMLVNNFSAGIWGGLLAVLGFFGIGPVVQAFSDAAGEVVDFLVTNNLLPLTSLFIEPAKILFLNNAINQGILTPLGTSEAAEAGKSVLFLLEANPGPGMGILLAFTIFGRGVAKASAPGAALIHFVGGIHEIYFPYVLMKPVLVLAVIAGGMTGVSVNVAFDSGLRSPASPGSIIAVLAATPGGSFAGVLLSVVASAGVSFLVASFLLKLDRGGEGDLGAATASMEAMKGKRSSVSAALTGGARPERIRSVVFACDAGMGSSAMGAAVLRRKVQEAGLGEVTVVNKAISALSDTYDLVVSHQDLTERARQRTPSAVHVSVDDFLASPRYDEVVELIQQAEAGGQLGAAPSGQDAAPAPAAKADELLPDGSVVLGGTSRSRDDAIAEAGRLLVAAGAVEEAYVAAMHERERSVSTAMGGGLAIPHGTNAAKGAIRHTGLSFVRYDAPLDWGGKEVRFVVGVAGAGEDHLALLGQVARVFSDPARVAELEGSRDAADVRRVLTGVEHTAPA